MRIKLDWYFIYFAAAAYLGEIIVIAVVYPDFGEISSGIVVGLILTVISALLEQSNQDDLDRWVLLDGRAIVMDSLGRFVPAKRTDLPVGTVANCVVTAGKKHEATIAISGLHKVTVEGVRRDLHRD